MGSDNEDGDTTGGLEDKAFWVDRAKTGRSGCKKCKQKIETGALRFAKVGSNPFSSGVMKMWHHLDCMFEVFSRQRASTKKVESVDDIGGWDNLSADDQEEILSRFPDGVRESHNNRDPSKIVKTVPKKKTPKKKGIDLDISEAGSFFDSSGPHKDDSLREFRRVCAEIANASGYLEKTAILKKFITYGTDGEKYKGDLRLLIKLLLPGVVKRVYNLQSKQIVKLFSRIFRADQNEMLESLELGDVAETIRIFFEDNTRIPPTKKRLLTIHDVEKFLDTLARLTKENDQIEHFEKFLPLCTGNDLKIVIRIIKGDLRINAGAKHILSAVHDDAYEAFQSLRDLDAIFDELIGTSKDYSPPDKKSLTIGISLLAPVLPMLAQPCKSVEEAFTRCPNGMYSEIKYDGERVQVHKKGHVFKYFSRSLKPVLPHKVQYLEDYIPKAFPHGRDLILDSEILMIDTNTGQPLPFGTLGKHKKNEYKDANVCLFVFDCLYYNGESLIHKPLAKRKEILHENMTEIKNRIIFSEMKEITQPKALEEMMTKTFRMGLEGLVLKDVNGCYEPGKRHWLKVKKDYLFGGAMADSADLVVLGAWYGTGQKGGMMSVFLMGCLDKSRNVWCTVTKVHTGHDDQTLARLQNELDMEKISRDPDRVPHWLKCTKTMIPDFVAKDPKKQPVWEISGAELTKHVVHTADGISIRFPRVSRIRDDKDWDSATSLDELKELFKKSKDTANFTLTGYSDTDVLAQTSSPRKRTLSPKKTASPTPPKKQKLETKYTLKNPLPDVFVGMKIAFPATFKQFDEEALKRYCIAYGGEVVSHSESDQATHIISDTINLQGKEKEGQVTVGLNWLIKCIQKRSLEPLS